MLALARRVGLANTTFRRHFPEFCGELPEISRRPDPPIPPTRYAQLIRDNAKLREANRELAEHLELAIANIRRLTLDNQQLQQALEAGRNIARLPARTGRRL